MENSIYERMFGLKPVINLASYMTALGGSTPSPKVLEAAREASKYFVNYTELLKRAGELIANLVGVEAAYVTSGSAAGVTLATAACLTGTDRRKITQLPDTEGMKNEVVVQKGHYPYNFMARLAGARIVYAGQETPEEPFEEYPKFHAFQNRPEHIEAAINENTCAILHVITGDILLYGVSFGEVPLQEVAKIARKHDIPLIVNAAAQIPPISNFKRIIDMGGSIAVFSGGKAIQSFNDTGIIVGSKQLIDACAMNGPPNHAIGRGFKVSKEEIVGTVVALQEYCALNMDEELENEKARANYVATNVRKMKHVKNAVVMYPDETGITQKYTVLITLNETALGLKATDVIAKLQAGNPPIYPGTNYVHEGALTVDTQALSGYEELRIFVERLEQIVGG